MAGATVSAAAGQTNSGVSQGPTAFVHVTVVPMDRERLLQDQTVVVRNGRIVVLGPAATTAVPSGAVIIDGHGRFLLPGLGDMHVHLPDPAGRDTATPAERRLAERALLLALAHGVTTVRNMDGRPWHLTLRDRAARGDLLSPQIYTAGPIFFGGDTMTPASAARLLEHEQALGYDFFKIYEGPSPAMLDSLAAASRRTGFPVAGHTITVDSEGVQRAFAAPYRSMEHFYGYPGYLLPGWNEERWARSDKTKPDTVSWHLDPVRLDRVVAETRRSGVWNVPTLTMVQWVTYAISRGRPAPQFAVLDSLVRKLGDTAGPPNLLLGTDSYYCSFSGLTYMVNAHRDAGPWVMGFAPRQELITLVAAGLTPYEALLTATRNVALFWGTERESGTVAVGKRADLVLVDRDPLTSFDGLARPVGVMLGGRWLPQAELDAKVAELGGADPQALACPS